MSAARRHHRSDRGLFDQRPLALDSTKAEPRAAAPMARTRLWFCIFLPELPLEAVATGEAARAVVEEQQGIHRVLLADARASAAGVMPGQSANAALSLLSALRIVERSEAAEQQALERLAAWLERFTSVVCLAGPDILLLEIAGSLRLYGGLPSLRQRIAAGLEERGFAASLAIAPTPLAATWLARSGRRACVREPANLPATLRDLPIACLGWPAAVSELLAGMGVRRIGDCLRLPREGLARRIGPRRLLELDRALGRLPDPRTGWRAPERFCAAIELNEEQSDRELLLAACDELLQAHERFLLKRQLGTQRIRFSCFHLRAPATQLTLGGARAERAAKHWSELLRLRFERLDFPEPVIAVQLRGGHTQPLGAGSARLAFRGRVAGKDPGFSITQLAGRLVARIGDRSVGGVMTVPEHRPQRAWCWRTLGNDRGGDGTVTPRHRSSRPLWMLAEPAPLPVDRGYPLHDGRLRILDGPERLETGWWDEDGIARDYYTAVNPCGMQLWVFRNRDREASWYLHGLFG